MKDMLMKVAIALFAFAPLAVLAGTLGEGLNCPSLEWTTGGNADWFPQTSVTHDGEDAVRSGAISGSQSTWIQTTVTGPKQIRFWWKTSSEANYDILRFYVDGTEKASVSGTTDWSQQTVQVTGTGTHTLKWQYSKDGSVNNGDDCGWVDQVEVQDPQNSDGLVARYEFDGNADDLSGYGNNLTNLSAVTFVQGRNGVTNGACRFDGTSNLKPQSTIKVSGEYSLAVWFRTDVLRSAHGNSGTAWNPGNDIIHSSFFNSDCYGVGLRVGTDGLAIIEHGLCYRPTVLSVDRALGNAWHHAAVIVSNGVETLYLDGVQVGSATPTSNPTRTRATLLTEGEGIGGGYWGQYTGDIDDLRIYNRVLSASEIQAIYEDSDDGLVAWYKFDNNLADSSGNNYDMQSLNPLEDGAYCEDRTGKGGAAISISNNRLVGVGDSLKRYSDGGSYYESEITLTNYWTFSCWFKTDKNTTLQPETTSGIYGASSGIQYLYFENTCNIAVGKNGINVFEHGSYYLPATLRYEASFGNEWHHLAVVSNGREAGFKLYVDGEFVREGLISGREKRIDLGWINSARTEANGIGGGYYGSSYDGCLDDLRFYNRALSAAEVSAIYNEGESDPTVYRTVTFNANGGTTATGSRRVEDGAAVGTLPDATRMGYRFLGWFTEVTGGTEVTEATEVTSDATCYAHWQANEYTIAFDGNGSTGGSTAGLSVAYDAETMLTANGFTKTGYSFAGWSRYAIGTVEYADQATVQNLTDEDGATVTLYAVWEAIDYSVSYYGNGSDWGYMSSQWFEYDSWENLNANQYGKTGYSFDGWATTSDGSVVYENGASVVNLASTAGADVGLFAKWRVNQYTVSFNANGGSTDMSSVTRDYGTAIGQMTDAWRTGYDFLGWFTSSSGGSQATETTTVTGNATLYAHWQLKTYMITVDANGGDAVPAFTRQHGSTIGSLPIPSRVGHVFKGWFTAPEGGERVGVSQVVTSDLALYAHWSTYAQEIAEAMPGATNVRFSTDDAAPWTRDASVSSDGESVRSYPIAAGGESAMEAQVYGSGNFMFDWRVSSASRVGVLAYYVDGVQKKQISGSVDWRTVDIEISGEGTHTVRWVYAKSGSDVSGSDCGWVDAISWSGGSFPVVSYTVSFNVNGGDSSISSVTRESGAVLGTLPTPTRANATFLGWFTAATGGSQVTAETTVTANMTVYAHWKVNDPQPGNCTVAFDANGGTCDTKTATVAPGSSVGALPTASRTGYAFVGWFTAATGGSQVSDSSIVNASATWYAHWQANAYKITYVDTKDAENMNPTSYTIADAVTFANLSNVDGWRFVGWSVTGIPAGSTGDKTVTANWEEIKTPDIGGGDGDDEEPMDASIANTYDGVIVDADGLPMGYISVKAAKATGKVGAKVSKVTATIQMVGEAKKVTVKASVPVAEAAITATAADGRVLDLTFSRYGIWGTFDGYEIDGVRNVLASTAKSDKGSETKEQAESVLNELKGNYVMAYGDENGWNGLSVSVMAKGKVKVSGKLANGTSVSTSTQLIVGDEYSVIPVFYTKGTTSLAFNVYYSHEDGKMTVFGYYDAVISPVTGLDSGLSFYLGESIYDLFEDYTLLDECLPDGLSVEPSGSKLIVDGGAKAGKIVWDKKAGEVNESKSKIDGYNVSGLKLTFTAKTGAFKGSFKVYAIDEQDSLRTFTATVSGVVVDGIGYGAATIKKIGNCAVVIAE